MVKSVAGDRLPITLCDDSWSVSSKIDAPRTSRLNILKLMNSEKLQVQRQNDKANYLELKIYFNYRRLNLEDDPVGVFGIMYLSYLA